MITFSDFLKLESLEHEIKVFIFEKCKEYGEAGDFKIESHLKEDFDWYEFNGLFLEVYFMEYRTFGKDGNQYIYKLPLDILFDSDFKDKMRIRFAEERENQRLKLIEEQKIKEAELERAKEKKISREIETLKELMGKYPEVWS